MTLIAYVFPKFWTAKDVVRYMSKKLHFRTSFDNQHPKRSQTRLNPAQQFFIIFYNISEGNGVGKCLS